MTGAVAIADGISLYPQRFDGVAQAQLVAEILALAKVAPFYRPSMPKSAKPFSVAETNFGTLGWISDVAGYRYAETHPVTGSAWPPIPSALLDLWRAIRAYPEAPECCLVNLYRAGTKMGLHQDRDEQAPEAPVVSISLGDDALFRFGSTSRKGATRSLVLHSGDVVVFGGPARLMFHGIDRVLAGSSCLIPGGGRINLTLRRVR